LARPRRADDEAHLPLVHMRADAVEHRCRAVTYGKVFDLDHVPVLSRCRALAAWSAGGAKEVRSAAEEGATAEDPACACTIRTGRGAAVIASSGARAMRAPASGNCGIGAEARHAPSSGADERRATAPAITPLPAMTVSRHAHGWGR